MGALRLVVFNQLYDFGLKGILCGVDRSDCFSESFLLELLFDRQAEFGELFNISAGVELQFLKLGQNGKRFLQLRRIGLVCPILQPQF